MTEPIEREQLKTLIDGSWYDSETGEYLHEDIQEFSVNDDSSLEWVMERIFNAEASKNAEQAKLEALIANCERKINRASSKAKWLRDRFSAEVEAYAKTKLDGKSKFVDTPYGRISFRTKKGGLRVADKDTAMEVAKLLGWNNAIKTTEEFQISKLTDDQRVKAQNYPAFVTEQETEQMSITTGIK